MSDRLSGLVLRHLPASLLSQRDRGVVCNLVRRRAPHFTGVIAALSLCTSALVPLVITAGASSAVAATPSCSATVPCAPTNVSFPQEGSWIGTATVTSTQFPPLLGDLPVCGIEGDDAPLTSAQVDAAIDDPTKLNDTSVAIVIGSNGYQASAGTTEGNYPDTESFGFTPATQLKAGDQITISLPHPAEPYSNSGSALPAAQVGSGATSEQTGATVTDHGPFPPVASISQIAFYLVTVQLPSSLATQTRTIQLNAYNPYDPPAVKNGPALNNDLEANPTSSGTSAQVYGLDYATDTPLNTNTNKTNSQGFANFVVEDSANEDVVVAATDITDAMPPNNAGLGILQTANLSFSVNGGNPVSDQGSNQECEGSQLSAPSGSAGGNGYTYLLIEDVNGTNVGYLVPQVAVSSASGVESATLTVPADVPTTSSAVWVEVLGAISPPGEGTPSNPLTAPLTPYPPDDFSISTNEDPVPGFPNSSTNPVFQADATFNSSQPPGYPVDGSTSTLTTSAPTAQVGTSGTGASVTATTTLLDGYNNAVNDKQVSIFQASTSPPTHADVAPENVPTPPANYPATGQDGTVTYNVSDTCAETVQLEAVDVDDNQPVDGTSNAPAMVPLTFTAGPAVAPDGTTNPAQCPNPVKSSVAVNGVTSTSTSAPATQPDDGTAASVTVTLGDQFGNADSCQQVLLTPTSKTSHAVVSMNYPTGYATTDPCYQKGYTNAKGVATFQVSDTAAEQVVLGVTDTTAISVWPTDPMANGSDVAQINFEGADAATSSVVASPTTAPADGQPAATVTVTLEDVAGQVEQGKVVTLEGCTNDPVTATCVQDPTSIITPTSAPTDQNGEATFQVADNSTTLPHTVYYQAIVPSDGVTVVRTASSSTSSSISFMQGGVSLSANPTVVVADGTGTSNVTFALKDTSGMALTAVPVVLTASPSSGATIAPAPQTSTNSAGTAVTNSAGTAVFTVNDTQAGPVSLMATATYPSPPTACVGILIAATSTCKVTGVVTVNFISPPHSFSISASPSTGVPADGTTSSQVTVTALDANGAAIADLPVSVTATASTTALVSPSTAVTGANGEATFSVTDDTPETVTLSAQYQETSLPAGSSHQASGCTSTPCTATIVFVPTEAEASTVTASPSSAPADGHSTVTVTVMLENGNGAPINGHHVVLSTGSATTSVVPSNPTNVGGVTGWSGAPAGVVSFLVSDTQPEPLVIYAHDEDTGTIVKTPAPVAFEQTEVQLSSMAAPSSVPAGGPPGSPATATVTVTLMGPSCSASSPSPESPAGDVVQLTTTSGTANITPAVAAVNNTAPYTASFSVSDPVVEAVKLTAIDTTCGVALANTATVNFVKSEANQSRVAINPGSTPAEGTAATLSVTLLSASGAPISGRLVSVPAVQHATVIPLASSPGLTPGVTNSSGLAQFAISDNIVEGVTLVAWDGTPGSQGATELDQVATENFTANEANQSSISPVPASSPASGPPITVTVSLVSGGGVKIAGDTVSLSAPSSHVSITPATATTNGSGVATFTVGDPLVESTVLTALDRTTGVTVDQALPITFTANEQNQSTATVSPTAVKVKKSATVTVTLLGPSGTPLSSHTVTLNTGSKTATFTPATGVTNSAGQATFSVTDTAAETLSIAVTDTTASVTLYASVTVTFTKS